jgi:hypothetical protein
MYEVKYEVPQVVAVSSILRPSPAARGICQVGSPMSGAAGLTGQWKERRAAKAFQGSISSGRRLMNH